MIDYVVDYIEEAIKQGRHKRVVKAVLWTGRGLSTAMGLNHVNDLVLQGIILQAEQDGDRQKAEAALLEYASKFGLKWSMLSRYKTEKMQESARVLVASGLLRSDQQQLLDAHILFRDGNAAAALEALSETTSENYNIRYAAMSLKRSIYHSQQMPAKVAEVMTDFIRTEPDGILISASITAAAAAETAQREDLFVIATSRILDDVVKIRADRDLFKRYWKDAAIGAASTFDLSSARSIAESAQALLLKAQKVVEEYSELIADLAPCMGAIDQARLDILVRCGRRPPSRHDGQAVVVIPGAAVRSNIIDYPGFRADVRFCVKQIIATLEQAKVTYTVKSRIKTHGELDFDVPFFSYHTISNSSRGLHFKETDRRGLFSFDTSGYAGWSSFSSTGPADWVEEGISQSDADSFFERDRIAFLTSRLSKYEQVDSDSELPEAFIFVALQILGDAVQSLAYSTPFKMLEEVIGVAKRRNLAVVVKRHPSCKSPEIAMFLERVASDIVLVTGNIHDVIPKAAAVCVINSGVGAEALTYEKPVYLFGRADYMPACFVCKHAGDFAAQFEPGKRRLSPKEFRLFWYAYRRKFACDVTDKSKAARWISDRVYKHLSDNQ